MGATSWWTTVDGLRLPRQVAGHPALELVNTRAGWDEPYAGEQEYLTTYDHLVVLARLNELVDADRTTRLRRLAGRDPEDARRLLTQAHALRADLRAAVLGTATPAASRRLGTAISTARARQELVVHADGGHWRFPGRPSVPEALDAFLVAAGDLLVEHPRVGACPGTGCGWVFLNRSGRRRWCQMAVCGNRAKQAAHAARARD